MKLNCIYKNVIEELVIHTGFTVTHGDLCEEFIVRKDGGHVVEYDRFGTQFFEGFLIILKENPIYKVGIFGRGDLILKDEKNPLVLWQKYKGKDYNIGNMCYQNYKPSIIKEYEFVDCSNSSKYEKKYNFLEFYSLDGKVCFVKYKSPEYKKPELKRCETGEEPGIYYGNCCPSEEYDLFMELREKVKTKEIKTSDDLKNFFKRENEKFEKTEMQAPKNEINFSEKVSQISFLESIIFTFLIFFSIFRG